MLTLRHLRILLVRTAMEFMDDGCSQMAAAISYYVLFSLFPLLIFSVGILGILLKDSSTQDDLVEVVLEYIPQSEEQSRDDVAQAIRGVAGVGSGALGILGLIGMVWSGSNMFGIIRRSLNVAYDLQMHRPLLRQKLLDLAMALSFAPFFVLSLVITGLIRAIRTTTESAPIVGDISEALGFGWALLPHLIPFALSFFAFAFLYWFVPATKIRLKDVWLGAALAATLFEAAKIGFSIYVENFSNYNLVFGSLGAVAAFLFWVYISANILLLGAEVASEYPRVMRGDYDAVGDTRETRPTTFRERVWTLLVGLAFHEHERRREEE